MDCENTTICLLNGGCGYSFCKECARDIRKSELAIEQKRADEKYRKEMDRLETKEAIKILIGMVVLVIALLVINFIKGNNP